MHPTQSRPIPTRIYEPNIVHNPFAWMGIWTPHGWRVHRKRWGKAQRLTITLDGDGKTTFFPGALLDPETRRVEWQDDLHLTDDPFTDGGIYPSDPRVEYPPGRPRWAVSHTLLCYPVADHNLYTHEYTWDMIRGDLQTRFRRHVALEETRTDSKDGMTLRVHRTPISRTIEGNVHYPLPNSAVRGVWESPDQSGRNLYTKRVVQRIAMHNAVYAIAPHVPVVQCHGMFEVLQDDPIDKCFDCVTGLCTDRSRVIEQMLIPLDEPKVALMRMSYRSVPSKVYEGEVGLLAEHFGIVAEAHVADARSRLATRFEMGKVGYAHANTANSDESGYDGYVPQFDLDGDGTISESDVARLARHVGRRVRFNLYHGAYFGGDWLTTTVCLTPEHDPGTPVVADYEYGGGYDAESGVVRLLESPGPNRPVWVEYHHDAAAEIGEGNIRVHLYREE